MNPISHTPVGGNAVNLTSQLPSNNQLDDEKTHASHKKRSVDNWSML